MLLDMLGSPPPVAMLEPRAAGLVRAMRVWAGLRMARRCPMEMAARRLGSLHAAVHLRLLMETMGAAWPDPIALAPPCCPVLSHDEATIGALLGHAGENDRRAFDRQCEEMLDADVRCRLWDGMRTLLAAVPA